MVAMQGRQRKPRGTGAKRRRTTAFDKKVGLAPATVKRSLGTDLNYYDTLINIGSTTTSWTYTSILLPTVGTGSTSRYGDKTLTTSIRWNFSCFPANITAPRFVRALLIYDKQPNGANPNPDVMPASVYAHPNPDLRYRYTILRDWLIPVYPAAVSMNGMPSGTPKSEGLVQRGLMRVNLDTQYTASAGAIADVASGSLIFAALDDAASPNGPSVVGYFRCLFKP